MSEIVENAGRVTCGIVSDWGLSVFDNRCLTYFGTIEVGGIMVTALSLLVGSFLLYLLSRLTSVKV